MTATTRGRWHLSARRTLAAGAATVLVAALAPAGVAHAADTFNRGTARACPTDPANAFTDDDGSVHEDNINCIASFDIVKGYADGTYRPSVPVTRAQMATYIVNEMTVAGYEFAAQPDDAFTDDDGNVHEGDINKLADAGVVKGDGNGNYHPNQVVSRAQMASYVNQAVGAVTGTTPTANSDYFTDDDGSVHEGNINALASLGVVQGDGQGHYLPADAVRRAPMASFVARSGDYLAEQGDWPNPNALDTAYQPDPAAPDTLTYAEVREYAVEVAEGTKVNVALFPAGDVTIANRGATFHDTATPSGVADLGATDARIIAVNGSRITDTQQVNDAAGFGTTLTIAVQSTADANVVPVFWTDTEGGTDHALDLDSSDAATEPIGVGGEATWSLTEAATGSSTPVVQGFATGMFATTNGDTYAYASGDTFEYKSQAVSQSDFSSMLSAGDVLSIDYDRSGASTFNITQDVTKVPAAPIAFPVDGANNDDVADYAGLLFTLPYGNNPATTYTLQRQDVTNPLNASGSCQGASSPASDSWDDVTTLADGTTAYTDGPLADGCYVYRIQTESPVQQAASPSDASEQVETGGTIDDTPPTIDSAKVTADNTAASDCTNADATNTGKADACDVHTFTFSENMASAIATGWYRVSDADGTIADIVCENNADKQANATCSYSDATPAGTPAALASPATLTVTLTADPTIVQAGSTPGLQYPATVVALSSGWKDAAGNHVTFQGSDRVLEVDEG